MKKTIILALVAFLTFATSFKAQAIEKPYPTGTIIAGAHVGFLPGIGANLTGDYVLVDSWWMGHFTAGAYAGFNWIPYRDLTSEVRFGFTNWSLMPRATYGLNILDELEVHVGAMAGINIQHWPNQYFTNLNYVQFCHGEFVGARYMFTDNLGVEAEIGYSSNIGSRGYDPYGMCTFNVGVTYQF